MELQEVQNCFFEYEDKRHEFLQETQSYYLQRGFQPYVWFDEEHRLRIKNKLIQEFSFRIHHLHLGLKQILFCLEFRS